MSALIVMQCFAAGLVITLQLYVLISVVILMPLSAINNIDMSSASPLSWGFFVSMLSWFSMLSQKWCQAGFQGDGADL